MFDGVTEISSGVIVPFHFEGDVLSLFLANRLLTLETGKSTVIGQKHGSLFGNNTLFHLCLPLENYGLLNTLESDREVLDASISVGTINQGVDYYIDHYEKDTTFTQMRFCFAELDYFVTSGSIYSIDDMTGFIFSRKPVEVKRFELVYNEKSITFILQTFSEIKCSYKSSAETKTELVLEFEKTDDIDILIDLYHLVHGLFSFICNRQNITLVDVVLIGERVIKYTKRIEGKTIIEEKTKQSKQLLVPINKYCAEFESDKTIGRTLNYSYLASNFDNLVAMFIDDIVSISSIHNSFSARSLLDLKQCLHITAAFEYYQRSLLPEISSQSTQDVYTEIKKIIHKYSETQSGKKKRKSKDIANSLSPAISLKEKIIKTYCGYQGWSGAKNILSTWFGDNIAEIAQMANTWRNELAHEKREFEPDSRVIDAMRLVEHLNYCIVLRKAGYSDDAIKVVLEKVLAR